MKKVFFATKNKGKVTSLSSVLSEYDIEVIQVPLDLPEPRSDDLRRIAKEKVLFAYENIKKPCVSIDAGFWIPSINGFPRAFVNFVLETIGIEGILKLVEGKNRDCEFRNCLAYIDENLKEPAYFESKHEGKLSENPIGEMKNYFWSELSKIFIPEGYDKVLSQMSFEEYISWKNQSKQSCQRLFAEWYSKRHCQP